LKKSKKKLKKSTEKLRKVQKQINELVEEAKSLRENPNREESVRPLLRSIFILPCQLIFCASRVESHFIEGPTTSSKPGSRNLTSGLPL
jgi:hypothetical protein